MLTFISRLVLRHIIALKASHGVYQKKMVKAQTYPLKKYLIKQQHFYFLNNAVCGIKFCFC